MGEGDADGKHGGVGPKRPGGFDLAHLASAARPREVTGATFSYVDAMLTGRMSEADLARIREDLLGEPATRPADPAMAHLESLMAAGDHAGALGAAEAILTRDATHAAAGRAAEKCRQHLADLYLSHLGGGHHVPALAVAVDALGSFSVDRWGAYLISRFDDHVTIDDLVHLTAFSRLDTFRILYELVQHGAVRIEHLEPPPSAPPSPPRVPAAAPGTVLARVKLKSIRG